MSRSSDAYFIYGIPLNNEWDEDYDRRNDAYRRLADYYFPNKTFDNEYEREGAVQGMKTGINIFSHCSDSYTKFFLGITQTEHIAYRGQPKRIELGDLMNDKKAIMDALAILDIAKDYDESDIGWYLMSYADM